jgi:alkylated DNA repair dioxygenase AlkB
VTVAEQPGLFADEPSAPPGLRYQRDLLSGEEEADIAAGIAALDLKPFEFHGFLGKRRVVSFGWRYVFDGSGLTEAEPIPAFLLPLRERAARFAGVEPDALVHMLVTEYAPGASIGWHKDRSVFGDTIGISLLSACRLRFRRRSAQGWERTALLAAPRSAYLLRGAARSLWEHSIPPVESLRYSVTMRTLASALGAREAMVE